MSESNSLVKLQRLLLISDSDMAAAAQQLIQLSDEDNNSSSSNNSSNGDNNKIIKAKKSKRLFEQSQDEITSSKIEEIFGKEEEVVRPIKQRRYRFLDSIYKETKPMKVSYGMNLWY
ncbi:Uncharacterized protein TCM_001308 [Theobroma cacao]|uniref:Uncharacterized protein n=1 Tax=Theobroma cacao TaxID=3641 RepID=A0A061DIF5_THECC|nr:Uncharacterized protein TCM_001308 [Theobroma cacao]